MVMYINVWCAYPLLTLKRLKMRLFYIPPPLLSLFILLFALTTSCEQEELAPMLGEAIEEMVAPEWNVLSEADRQAAYEAAADEFEYTYWYGISEGEVLGSPVVNSLVPPRTTSRSELENQLNYYAEKGIVAKEDASSLLDMLAFFDNCGWDGQTSLTDVSNQLNRFIADNNLNQFEHPVTFHTVELLEEMLVNNPVSRSIKGEAGNELFKNDDGQLCSTSGWFCPSESSVAAAAAEAAATAAAAALKKVLIKAAGPVGAIIAVLIKDAIKDAFSGLFCNVQCDECGPPAGVMALYNSDCSLREIRAAGTFEFAERWEFPIDENLDGTFDRTLSNSVQNRASGSSITSDRNRVIADVICDDGEFYGWAGPRNQPVFVASDQRQMSPVAWINRPPAQSGFLLPLNTQLCFSLTELGDGTWDRVSGWTVNDGGLSNFSGSTTFCRTFTGSSRMISLGVRYRNPCNTSQERFITTSFVVQ